MSPPPTPSERDAGRLQNQADRLLLEAGLIGRGDLVEPGQIFGMAGQDDLHDLARLAHDLPAGLVPPLPGGIEYREPIRKARRDLAVDELIPLGFADTDA